MQIAQTHIAVTGGGSGLGEAVVRALAGRGVQVTVIDRNAEAAHRLAAMAWRLMSPTRRRARRLMVRLRRRGLCAGWSIAQALAAPAGLWAARGRCRLPILPAPFRSI